MLLLLILLLLRHFHALFPGQWFSGQRLIRRRCDRHGDTWNHAVAARTGTMRRNVVLLLFQTPIMLHDTIIIYRHQHPVILQSLFRNLTSFLLLHLLLFPPSCFLSLPPTATAGPSLSPSLSPSRSRFPSRRRRRRRPTYAAASFLLRSWRLAL